MFKVGQLVRIKDNFNGGYIGMMEFRGKIARIIECNVLYNTMLYKIDVDGGYYNWDEESMDSLTRNNLKIIKVENNLYFVSKDTYEYIKSYNAIIDNGAVYIATSESEIEETDIFLTKIANGFQNYKKSIGLLN